MPDITLVLRHGTYTRTPTDDWTRADGSAVPEEVAATLDAAQEAKAAQAMAWHECAHWRDAVEVLEAERRVHMRELQRLCPPAFAPDPAPGTSRPIADRLAFALVVLQGACAGLAIGDVSVGRYWPAAGLCVLCLAAAAAAFSVDRILEAVRRP